MLRKKKYALFTIVRNEKVFLPIWYSYYTKYFKEEDVYILDHASTDLSTNNYKNVIEIKNYFTQDHNWMANVSNEFQKKLLKNYKWVFFSHVDEIICPDPNKYLGIEDFLIKNKNLKTIRCKGYEVIQFPEEKDILESKKILLQRRYWFQNDVYSKPLITRTPVKWSAGWHSVQNKDISIKEDILLIHLHRFDFNICKQKRVIINSQKIYQKDLKKKWGWYVYLDQKDLKKWFYDIDCSKILDAQKSFICFEKNKIKTELEIINEARKKCEFISSKWKLII